MTDNTAHLAISKKHLNCHKVVHFLYQMKIESSVTTNKSVVCNNKMCYVEHGCNITLSDMTTEKINNIWNLVQKKFDLDCAHVNTHNFKGCIHTFLDKTKFS